MARGKRARSVILSSSEDEDEFEIPDHHEEVDEPIPFQNRFLPGAQKYYNEMHGRKIVSERHLVTRDKGMRELIKSRHWGFYYDVPCRYYQTMVSEFYSNAAVSVNALSTVRGVVIRCDAARLGKIMNIPHVDENIFKEWKEDVNPEEIRTLIKKGNCQWKYEKTGGKKAQSLPMSDFTEDAKFWYYFVRANIMPTTAGDSVTFDRCALVHAILTDIPVSLPHLILDSLKANRNKMVKAYTDKEKAEKRKEDKEKAEDKETRKAICIFPSIVALIMQKDLVPMYKEDGHMGRRMQALVYKGRFVANSVPAAGIAPPSPPALPKEVQTQGMLIQTLLREL